ncbi:MAG: hypothetical protein QF719_02615 [Chloroflexota bacterium]|jgi:hypothetical protein|nr:hypothetical protein [Chloroflexota bacterium]MDP6508246.1 hypothetical protein [Chloroflexota bacterium]MDP6757095.1 hypothetical protein [Chloroflexota bacterium]
MAQAQDDQLKRRNVNRPGFLEHVETASLKDAEDATEPATEFQQADTLTDPPPALAAEPVAPATPEPAPATTASPTASFVTRLTPPPLSAGEPFSERPAPGTVAADQRNRDDAEPLLSTRWIVVMLLVGLAAGAIIGAMAGMSLFP